MNIVACLLVRHGLGALEREHVLQQIARYSHPVFCPSVRALDEWKLLLNRKVRYRYLTWYAYHFMNLEASLMSEPDDIHFLWEEEYEIRKQYYYFNSIGDIDVYTDCYIPYMKAYRVVRDSYNDFLRKQRRRFNELQEKIKQARKESNNDWDADGFHIWARRRQIRNLQIEARRTEEYTQTLFNALSNYAINNSLGDF